MRNIATAYVGEESFKRKGYSFRVNNFVTIWLPFIKRSSL